MPKRACQHCEQEVHARDLCERHYWRLRKYGDPLASPPPRRRPATYEETTDSANAKRCCACRRNLPREAFHRNNTRKDGLQTRCKECYRAYYNRRYRDDAAFREKRSERFGEYYEKYYSTTKDRKNAAKFERMYGITRDDFERMSAAQGHRCSICGRIPYEEETVPRKKHLCVDHEHATGVIRGLLCDQCNTGLGMFRDDPQRLAAAIRYLARPPGGSSAAAGAASPAAPPAPH